MATYGIGEARYEGDKLVEVAIQCMELPQPPHYHLYECAIWSVDDVVELLELGEHIVTIWRLPDGSSGSIPIEVVTLPDGEKSIEVVQRGQPPGYRMVNLPRIDGAMGDDQPLAHTTSSGGSPRPGS